LAAVRALTTGLITVASLTALTAVIHRVWTAARHISLFRPTAPPRHCWRRADLSSISYQRDGWQVLCPCLEDLAQARQRASNEKTRAL
jgi:hypothetical protein